MNFAKSRLNYCKALRKPDFNGKINSCYILISVRKGCIMKKLLMIAAVSMVLLASGCGNNTETEFVQVEIEKIEDIVTPAVEEISADDNNQSADIENVNAETVETIDETPDEADVIDSTSAIDEAGNDNVPDGNESDAGDVEDKAVVEVNLPGGEKEASSIYIAVVGNTPAEILEVAKDELMLQGYKLEVFSQGSFDAANELVANGTVDASLCINKAYMDSYNTVHGTSLSIVEHVYYEPLGLFAGKTKGVSKCPSNAVIAVPEGEIAMARALYLLEQKGMIEIKSGASYQACIDDITANKHNISFERYDISQGLPDKSKYDYYIADFNHVLVGGIDPASALGYENRNSKLLDMFTIDLVSTAANSDSQKLSLLSKVLNSKNVEKYIEDTYVGTVVDYR